MRCEKIIIALLVSAMTLCGCGSTADEKAVSDIKETSDIKEASEGLKASTGTGNIEGSESSVVSESGLDFTAKLKCGWSLGNTFDATDDNTKNPAGLEFAWVGVRTSEDMIKAVHAAGFETLRLPVSWHNHVSGDNYTIDKAWLDRVEEVASWALNDGMYVIINIHHDEQQFYPSSERISDSKKYVSSIWTQLSDRFKDYDEHLIFETLNEPRLVGTSYEWNFQEGVKTCLDSAECINELNQLAVDTIRKSGGNNANRYIMVPGYSASPDAELKDSFKLPDDPAGHIIVSVHSYAPYGFALQPDGENGVTDSFSTDDPDDTKPISDTAKNLYNKFIANGIPVIVGEYGSVDRNGNTAARVEHAKYYTKTYKSVGIPCIWWDNNFNKGKGERFGIFDRKTLTFNGHEIVDAIMEGCK